MHKTGGNGLENKVRFAFWGAEELNLIGSRFYVSQLTPAQRATITINVNFDMLASSNGVYFVQDGDGAHTGGTVQPGRSAELEHVLTSYLASQGLPWVPRPYDGRSDYQRSSSECDLEMPCGSFSEPSAAPLRSDSPKLKALSFLPTVTHGPKPIRVQTKPVLFYPNFLTPSSAACAFSALRAKHHKVIGVANHAKAFLLPCDQSGKG